MNKFFEMLNPFQGEKETGTQAPVITPVILPNSGVTDPKVVQYFDELMKKANLPGPDYHEFKKALREMTNVPEEVAIKTTFVAFKTMGVDKLKLTMSIDEYINIIKKDTEGFQGTVDKKIETEVTTKEKQIQANTARVTVLQKEIEGLYAQNIKLQQEVSNSRMAIDNTKNSYIRTSGSIISEMESDKTKINQYL